MAVKNSKPVIVDIDEVSQIQVGILLTGGLNPGPHVGLEVRETYIAFIFLDVTRRLRREGFVTASVQTTALWSVGSPARCRSRTAVLGAHHNPVQDMAALMGGYLDELSEVVPGSLNIVLRRLTCPSEQSS